MLDASVLIALLDQNDANRPVARAAVAKSQRDHDLVIPAVAFSESLVAQYRRSHREGQLAEARLMALGGVVDVNRDIASRAAQLRATRKIKLPDALILATAMQLPAQQILTVDKQWQGVDSRVVYLQP
ncbi:MAG: type II toxin-antitoxin system VapC family toxin, partial [Candidatus Dormibacteraceae bacterium]